jgi:trk system potassium uptake protein TrkH
VPLARRPLAPPQLLAFSIAGLILAGAILLSLPMAAADGRTIPLVDAVFTAASAVCVTGLITLDTPNDLSLFGQIVVLLLIQAGGLGYMTITTVFAAALGRAVTLQERLTLQEALNVQGFDGLVRFARTVFKLTLVFELAGAALLAWAWWAELGPGHALWFGLFHAVSAFNNAGFSLFSHSLIPAASDVPVVLVVATLFICGGLGFFVLTELIRLRRRDVRLSLHTRVVLLVSLVLLALGTAAILALEWANPRTLGALTPGERVLAAFFQSATARTAGFNSVDVGSLTTPTLFLMMALMFIGASPGSTGGGVKTTTFSITVAALWATVRGHGEPVVFGRRLPAVLVTRAFFISLISFLALNVVSGLLLVTEGREMLPTLFETTSAFGTVGLSMGHGESPVSLVAHFSTAGKILVMAMLFMGRVGPLTLAFAVARRAGVQPKVRYPEGKLLIG